MKRQFVNELGANTVVGLLAAAWVFGQSPLPDQLRSPATLTMPAQKQDAGLRGDKITSVQPVGTPQINITIEPTAQPAPLPVLGIEAKLLKVAATSLKLRAEPSSRSKSMRVYPNGSAFEQIGQDGKWLQVRHIEDGTSGWMYGAYLQATN